MKFTCFAKLTCGSLAGCERPEIKVACLNEKAQYTQLVAFSDYL